MQQLWLSTKHVRRKIKTFPCLIWPLPFSNVKNSGTLHHHHLQLLLDAVEGHMLQGPVPIIVIILNKPKYIDNINSKNVLCKNYCCNPQFYSILFLWKPFPCCAWRIPIHWLQPGNTKDVYIFVELTMDWEIVNIYFEI